MCVFVACGIQHAMRMGRIVVCGLPALQYFSTLPHKWHFFREKKIIEREVSFSSFSTTLSKIFLILKEKLPRCDENAYWISCKLPFNLVRLKWNFYLLDKFSKNTEISNFMKIQCDPSCSMRTVGWMDGQTDRQRETEIDIDNTKLIVEFHNGPKNALLQNRTRHR